MTDAEPSVLDAKLAKLRKANADKYQSVSQQGLRLDPSSVIMTRLNSFIDFVFDADKEKKINFELIFEEQISQMLEQAEGQLTKARLLAPPQAGVPGVGLLAPDGSPVRP